MYKELEVVSPNGNTTFINGTIIKPAYMSVHNSQ